MTVGGIEGLSAPPHQEIDQQHWYAQLIAALNSLGLTVEDQDGEEIEGDLLALWKALDADENSDGNPRIIPRATHDLGSSLTGNLTLDYDNGGTQKGVMTGDLTVDDIDNLNDGGWMNLRVETGGNTLTFDGAAFEGPSLSFTNPIVWVSLVDFAETRVAVMGGGN